MHFTRRRCCGFSSQNGKHNPNPQHSNFPRPLVLFPQQNLSTSRSQTTPHHHHPLEPLSNLLHTRTTQQPWPPAQSTLQCNTQHPPKPSRPPPPNPTSQPSSPKPGNPPTCTPTPSSPAPESNSAPTQVPQAVSLCTTCRGSKQVCAARTWCKKRRKI